VPRITGLTVPEDLFLWQNHLERFIYDIGDFGDPITLNIDFLVVLFNRFPDSGAKQAKADAGFLVVKKVDMGDIKLVRRRLARSLKLSSVKGTLWTSRKIGMAETRSVQANIVIEIFLCEYATSYKLATSIRSPGATCVADSRTDDIGVVGDDDLDAIMSSVISGARELSLLGESWTSETTGIYCGQTTLQKPSGISKTDTDALSRW
jgi:hypothetical protein